MRNLRLIDFIGRRDRDLGRRGLWRAANHQSLISFAVMSTAHAAQPNSRLSNSLPSHSQFNVLTT